MINQPELGKKISSLRKAKGWTQEELVEKCNISVRTIQRIETGEVTPRSFTIKTILAALDYDFSKVVQDGLKELADEHENREGMGKWFPVDASLGRSSLFLKRHLNIALIGGLFYFMLSFVEGFVDYLRMDAHGLTISTTSYIVIKLSTLVAYIFFQRGLIVIGNIFNNYLLKVVSLMLITATAVLTVYDIASVYYDSVERPAVYIGAAITFGAVGVIFGISLRRLEKHLGRSAEWAGLLEILSGICFLTVVLSLVGLFLLSPAQILEIVMIFKVIEMLKNENIS